jgi:hypothetical protein
LKRCRSSSVRRVHFSGAAFAGFPAAGLRARGRAIFFFSLSAIVHLRGGAFGAAFASRTGAERF